MSGLISATTISIRPSAATLNSTGLASHRRPHLPCRVGRIPEARTQCSADAGPSTSVNRRNFLASVAAGAVLLNFFEQQASALPLAPLGKIERVGGAKLTGLQVEEVKEILEGDLRDKQYFVTGNLTKEIFADDCRFVDPTNDVTGLSKYLKALGILFDPAVSSVQLRDIRVVDRRTIEADWVLGGYLQLPWRPRIDPFEGMMVAAGHTVYRLNSQGLVQSQEQRWSISAPDALLQTFTPSMAPWRQLL